MGDRGNIVVREGKDEVWLYTHWCGSEIMDMARSTIKAAPDRWTDAAYLARVAFCKMVAGHEDQTTGFGVWVRPMDNEHNVVVLDCSKKELQVYHVEMYGGKDAKRMARGTPKSSVPFGIVSLCDDTHWAQWVEKNWS